MYNLTTPPIRLSYPTLFEARSVNGGTPTFSAVLMFDKTNKEHMDFLGRLKKACDEVMVAQWPDVATRPRIPAVGHDRSPIKDGDKCLNSQGVPLAEKNPEYAGQFIVRASSNSKPLVVDQSHKAVLDKSTIQAGDWVLVNINPYPRKRTDNPGVSIGLNGVMFDHEGEHFGGGRPSVTEMFGASGADDPNNYANPMGEDSPF